MISIFDFSPVSSMKQEIYWDWLVEILVTNEEDIESAINQIEMIAKKLEFTMNEERGGKVLNYLKQHRPCAYSTYMDTFRSSWNTILLICINKSSKG